MRSSYCSALRQLSLRLQQERALRPVELTCAGVAGAVLDRGGQIFERDVADRHCRRVRLDPHGRLRAVHRNLAHARQDAEPLADLRVGVVVQLSFGDCVADQHQVHDRLIVRVRLGERRRTGQIDRQLSRGPRDRRLHVRGSAVEALGKIELQDEVGVSLGVVGSHQLQPRNLHELALQRRGHVVGHRLRRRARIVHLHLNDRVVDSRQIADRQLKICDQSEQNDGDAQRNRHHRTANE